MNIWKSVTKAQTLIASSRPDNARDLISKLPDNFSHKHYLLADIFAAKGDHRSAFDSLFQAITLAEDKDLKDLYVRELLNLKHSEELDMDYLEKLLGRKFVFDEGASDSRAWISPLMSPKELRINSDVLQHVVESEKTNSISLSLEGTAWEVVANRDKDFLVSDEEIHFQLDDLIGAVGSEVPTISMRLEYLSFLTQGSRSRYRRFCSDVSSACELSTNLGSRMDVQIVDLVTNVAGGKSSGLDIMEVGGGYGRLCEALISNSENLIRNYYLVDAVPSSIASAYEYLGVNLPFAEISVIGTNLNRPGNGAELRKTSIFIVPSWELADFVFPSIDLAINVESFQEMSMGWVSFYMELFQKSLSEDGFVYLSNSRCYKNKSMPEIGSDWNVQLFVETPRSWTPDHPTIVLTKSGNSKDYSVIRNSYVEPWKIVI